jgi:hypothetical protein
MTKSTPLRAANGRLQNTDDLARAERSAKRVREHWHRKGYTDVPAEVVKEPWSQKSNTAGYTVRTNLVNGLPEGYTGKTLKL